MQSPGSCSIQRSCDPFGLRGILWTGVFESNDETREWGFNLTRQVSTSLSHDPYRCTFRFLALCIETGYYPTLGLSAFRELTFGSSKNQVILKNREVLSINSKTFETHAVLLFLTSGKGQSRGDSCRGRYDKCRRDTDDEHMREGPAWLLYLCG